MAKGDITLWLDPLPCHTLSLFCLTLSPLGRWHTFWVAPNNILLRYLVVIIYYLLSQKLKRGIPLHENWYCKIRHKIPALKQVEFVHSLMIGPCIFYRFQVQFYHRRQLNCEQKSWGVLNRSLLSKEIPPFLTRNPFQICPFWATPFQ